MEGGTTITVVTSVNLDNYDTDDVKVYVGGESEWGREREGGVGGGGEESEET